jgi:hypothetical protein
MYDLGDTVTVAADCRNATGVLANATTATLTLTKPDGTADSPAPANPPTTAGKYTHAYATTQFGLYRYRWTFAGGVPAQAYADAFNVVDQTWPAFVGLAEVKDRLNIDPTDTAYDDELRGFILSASEVVEDIVGVVARRTFTETYSGCGERTVLLRRRPVLSITAVTENGVTVPPSQYSVDSAGVLTRRVGFAAGRWLWGVDNINVVYVAGRTAGPWSVIDATKELIRINWRPQQGGNYSPFDGGDSDDFGVSRAAEGGLQGEIRLGFFVPNTVMQRLQPHARGPHIA